MKTSTIVMLFICICLLGTMFASATKSEIRDGMSVVAINGGALSGTCAPTSTSIQLGDSTFTRDFNDGEMDVFAALFANDGNSLGAVSAVRYATSGGYPNSAYETLGFTAPSTPMNILLKQSTIPSTITPTKFTNSIKEAVKTWNEDNGVGKTFFGSVSNAPSYQRAQANDGKFVHSFGYSTSSWLAGNWLTWKSGVLKDSDVIYNKKYKWETTESSLVWDASKYYVDLPTVALHELGHNVGLDDIYNKRALLWDETEVMNDYHWGVPKLDLGKGDLAGLKAIYG